MKKVIIILDGVFNKDHGPFTPDGLISIITTNNKELLDEALFRPGRIDNQYKIEYFTKSAAQRMVRQFLGKEDYSILKDVTYPAKPSEIQEKLLGVKDEN